jgi:Protein of unknown function (DUF402)
MHRLIRIDKRIPDGSIWQARRSYLLPSRDGWTRVYAPAGTEWSNPLGGWKTQTPGVSLFHSAEPFTISCHGPDGDKRFYIDIADRVRVDAEIITFTDLYLDVMIDPSGVVTEKDEHQLALLSPELREFARAARDDVRARIASADPLFDARSVFYEVPRDALALPPATGALAI